MRMLAERAKGMQTDVYVRFIDYVKAFDRVRYEALFEKQVRRRQYYRRNAKPAIQLFLMCP